MKRSSSICSSALFLFAAVGLHAQTIGVDKPSLAFSAQVNGQPVQQTLNITTSTGSVNFTTFPGAQWLRVNPVSGTAPSALTVIADPAGLLPGNYGGTLQIFGINTNTVSVNVTLSVGALSVTPSSLTFAYQVGANTPAAQTINLSSATGTAVTLGATTASGGNWLQVSPTSGNSPGTATVSLNPAVLQALGPGTYNGSITVTPATGSAVTLAVTLTITGAPPVTVSPSSVSLGFQLGGTNNAAQQTINLATTGTQGVAFALLSNVNPNPANQIWFDLSATGGTIPANGSVPVTVSYRPSANLPAGTYTGSITLFSPGGAPTQQNIPVTLLVSASPLLNVSPGALTFNYQVGTPAPAAQNVTVSSTSGQLPLTIATSTTPSGGTWLSAPTAGTSGTPFAVSINPAGLGTGTYNGTITVTGAGAANGPLQIPVTLQVNNNAVIVTSVNGCSTTINQNCPLTFAAAPGQQPPQNLKISSSTGAALNFTAAASFTGAANACGGAWLLPGGTLNTSGVTEATIQVTAQSGSIPSGSKCDGTIVITATNAATGVAVPNSPFNIPVTFYVNSAALLVPSQNAFNFTGPQAGTTPPTQSMTLTSTTADVITYQTVFTTATGGNWLVATPQQGTTAPGANVVTVGVFPGLLSAGVYSGTITLTATGPGGAAVANSPIVIPVTYTVTAGTMSVAPNTLTFSQTAGAAAPAAQTLNVTATGQALSYNVTAQVQNTSANINWLTATPASGNTPGAITVTADGSKLPAGVYNGSVTITSTTPATGGSPAIIPVTLNVTGGTISADPTSLEFTVAVNTTNTVSKSVIVAGTPGPIFLNVTAVTDSGGNWLTTTPTSGNAPGVLTVNVNPTNLALGKYTGKVTLTAPPPGATGSPLVVPVTLNVVSGQTLTVTPTALTFAAAIGTANPAAQSLAISATGGAAPFTATAATASGGNWLSVTPASGNTPGNVSVSVNAANLATGNYTGTVTITSPNSVSPVTVNVALTVSAIPKPIVNAIGNAGSYATGAVAPGENIVIFGTGIGPATLANGTLTGGAFSTTAGNTQVTFDGTPAPVIYASATQTSVMVPYGIFGRSQTVVRVTFQGVQSDALSYNVATAAPGIYTLNQSGTGPGAILNQDFSVNGPNHPAAKGSVVAVYMTGEGATDVTPADGAIAPTNGQGLFRPRLQPVTATIGGIAATVEYAGTSPGIVYGVMQANITIPANAPSGAQPLVITFGAGGLNQVSTQAGVTVTVQ